MLCSSFEAVTDGFSFGQEHPTAVTEIQDVTTGGQPGQAATIAGGSISNLLAAANPCAKVCARPDLATTQTASLPESTGNMPTILPDLDITISPARRFPCPFSDLMSLAPNR